MGYVTWCRYQLRYAVLCMDILYVLTATAALLKRGSRKALNTLDIRVFVRSVMVNSTHHLPSYIADDTEVSKC